MTKFQTVRGMRDFLPEQAAKKQQVEDILREVFERYGFAPLETPIVEEFALLSKKGSGGEDIGEEIYCFKDKSGRELGLRFDLTVPLARVVANNPELPKPFKRYQIGPVYRYDRPGASRYRSFTQADWDILGSSTAAADFETIAIAIDAMKALGFKQGEFEVKVNNRKLLEEIALCCDVQEGKVVECFRCLDKLEKQGKEAVKRELEQKGIGSKILTKLDEKGLEKLELRDYGPLEEMKGLLRLLKQNKLEKFVSLDLGLARGLEYYTGMVLEVRVKGFPSVGGGGRYDSLVQLYGGQPTPAVGCSFGVERLLEALEGKIEAKATARILIAPIGENLQQPALQLAQKMRAAGINASLDLNARGISKNLDYANKLGIPFVAILGENEAKKGQFTLKDMRSGKERKISLKDAATLKKLLK